MGTGSRKTDYEMLSRLFFNMLPVQVLTFAMGSINTIVDGAVAGRFVGPNAVGIVGLFFPVVNILAAIGSMFIGGTTVLCGRYIGKGDMDKTNGIFSLNLTASFAFGTLLSIISLVIPRALAVLLGASDELKGDLVKYIIGYAFGIIPMLLAQQIAAFLQMERQNKLGYIGIVGSVISNVAMDMLFVAVLKMGILGLGIASACSSLIYFLILAPYYLSSKAQLHYSFKNALWSDFGELCKIGFPGALLVFCLSARSMVINRILLKYAGNDGLSAMSAFNMILGVMLAYCLGNGSVIRMLTSIFVSEEDKYSIRKTLRIALTKGLILSVIIAGIMVAVSPYISGMFFSDPTSNVYRLNHQLLVIYCLCIPLVLLCQIASNYFQAIEHRMFVNFQSVFDGFLAVVIPSVILAPLFGAFGVWIANPIGIVLTLLLIPVYSLVYWKRLPRNVDERMFLPPRFGLSEDRVLEITIHDMEELIRASEGTKNFCENCGMGKKTSYYAALCLEEMAGNVIKHGFEADSKKHFLSAMILFKEDSIILRIKDDCIAFDPKEMAEIASGDSIGIRMIYNIADEVMYQNMLGLNVLTVKFREKNLVLDEKEDYVLEKALHRLDKDLHRRFRDTIVVTQMILSKYKLYFPEYTDHTELHSMTVIDSCGRLIGTSQIDRLNADEIYILLSACYFHDAGMGIGEKDYEEFAAKLDRKAFFEKNPNAEKTDFIRAYHHEFSGLFVEKYADLFDIPSPEHIFAIKQVARGHRKTDLLDEKEYPADYRLPNGNTVCLPYLAALIRLADEIDVVASRNPLVIYDMAEISGETGFIENMKLKAVESMYMTESAFVLSYNSDDDRIVKALGEMCEKMQNTLDYCRDVVHERTEFRISQNRVILKQV